MDSNEVKALLDKAMRDITFPTIEEVKKEHDTLLNPTAGEGSSSNHRRNTRNYSRRGRVEAYERIMNDCFVEYPTYEPQLFHRRFRMEKHLFLRIMEVVVEHDGYFVQKRDAARMLGFSAHQKCTAAIRMLAYGCSADSLDEILRKGASTIMDCLRHFCVAAIGIYK